MATADAAHTRAQLEGMIDRYLEALVAGDPSRLPTTPDVTFSENYQPLALGEGTWVTIDGPGTYRHYFADLQAGRAGFIGTVRENRTPALLDIVLQLDGDRISGIETFIIRDALAGARYEHELGAPEAIWLEPVAPKDRLPRERMIATVDKYFQSMQRNDGLGDYSFFDPECNRIEHALQTTNVKKPQAYGHSHDTDFSSMTAEQQWKTGFLGFVTEIRDRRFLVVDEERQAVFAFATFDHNGTVRVLHQTTGKDFVVPPYFDVPRTLQIMEAFRLKGDRLYRIEMTLTELPYGIRPPGEAAPLKVARPAPTATDRGVLEAMIERVLAAMRAHNPAGLPLANDVRYSEDGQTLAIGDGLWGTLSAYAGAGSEAPPFRIVLADPGAGEAVFLGGVIEETTPGILYLRIRVAGPDIVEIEAVAIRHEEMGERGGTVTLFQPRLLTDFDPGGFDGVDAAFADGTASSRAVLTGAVERYFDAIERGSSADVPLAKDCVRRDNGVLATNNPEAAPLDPAQPAYRPLALGCAAQIDGGYFGRISGVRERRHLVDEARGLVLSVAVFDNPARIKAFEAPGVGEVALPGRRAAGPGSQINSTPDEQVQAFGARMQPNVIVPASELVVQLTRVDGGKITRIETLSRGGPFGLSAGWAS